MIIRLTRNSKILLFIKSQIFFRKISRLINELEREILNQENPNKVRVMQFFNGETHLRKLLSPHGDISIIISLKKNKITGIQFQDQSTGKNIITWKAMLDKHGVVKVSKPFIDDPKSFSRAEDIMKTFFSGQVSKRQRNRPPWVFEA